MSENQDFAGEIDAMRDIGTKMECLSPEARARVLSWAQDRYGDPSARAQRKGTGAGTARAKGNAADDAATFGTAAELLSAASATADFERVLVIGYWFQVVQGCNDLEGQVINGELKNLGHGVKNITSALGSLISQRPQLAIQVRKGGATKQARKRYKLTTEGINRVKAMLANGGATAE
jgi:hypothetical protein